MKLSDYVANYIAKLGTRYVFLVTGGACVHLVDSIGKHPELKYICVQHEQAGAMAAEAYSRVGPGIGVSVATSGPGATNFITGICCAWFDSIPLLCLSGQVNISEQKNNIGVRQLGFQETDIVTIARPVTKFSAMVADPQKIKYFLDKAVYLAVSGRPGPVLLDIPLNVQHAEINPENLEGFVPSEEEIKLISPTELSKKINLIKDLIRQSKRPVILAGGGIKIAKAENQFLDLAGKLGIPVVCSWSGFDIVPHSYPLFVGQIGIYGNRGANFLIQNSDLLISIGSRLDTRQVTANPVSFARSAKKIVVDLDASELNKGLVKADVSVNADAKEFLSEFLKNLEDFQLSIGEWLAKAQEWKTKYPGCLPEYESQPEMVNPYFFIKVLSEELADGEIIIPDEGGNLVWTMQAFQIKKGQRLFSAFGNSPMGYALPASIGAALATGKERIICIDGDGGFQMNIQELQTVAHYKLPVKIFILNNRCYGIIRQFQDVYFGGGHEASVPEKGYSSPDFLKVANAYGLASERIDSHKNLREKIRSVLSRPGAVLCDVLIKEDQKLMPKLEAVKTPEGRYISKPIEDQWPYLPREEFKQNMIIEPYNN